MEIERWLLISSAMVESIQQNTKRDLCLGPSQELGRKAMCAMTESQMDTMTFNGSSSALLIEGSIILVYQMKNQNCLLKREFSRSDKNEMCKISSNLQKMTSKMDKPRDLN